MSFGGSIIYKMCMKKPEAYAGAIFLSPGFR